MKKYRYTYGGALIGSAEKKAIAKVVDSNYWPLASEGEKMEKEAAKFLGVKYGVLANSGSSAGLLALSTLELPKGSEVIIPATTFPTIFNIILQCGLVPVVVDVNVGTYNLDPDELKAAIGKKTKAIICVHAVGNPVDMPAVMKITKNYEKKGQKIWVIEDNCDGWGGTIGRRKVGSFADISFTSFHAAHIVSMGQGGGVFTNDKELARKARMYRDWGRQSDIKTRRTNGNKWPSLPEDYDARFIYEKIGYNLSPLELQAAMGRVQLRKINKIKRLRQRNFSYLYEKLSQFPDLILPKWIKNADPSWFSFPLSTKGERKSLVAFLEKRGIETRSMFCGNVIRHPAFVNIQYRKVGNLKEADWILYHSFWLGCHPRYNKKDLDYVIKTFKDFYSKKIRKPPEMGGRKS